MYRFIESIRLENGRFPWLEWHQKRVDNTMLYFKATASLRLIKLLETVDLPLEGVYKIRVLYSLDGATQVSLQPYQVKQINTFRLVELPEGINYAFKFEDRNWLEDLLKKAGTDDIILHKNGDLLDASYANLVIRFGSAWFTPQVPLLNGTCRTRLLEEGKILAARISIDDLVRSDEIRWINAMIPWEEAPRMNQMKINSQIII